MCFRYSLAVAVAIVASSTQTHAHSVSGFGGWHSHGVEITRTVPAHGPGSIVLAQANETPKTSGQGEYRFRVLYTGQHLPSAAVEVLIRAHGGFAVDRREGRGEIYFALPGAGIIRISPDLATTELLPTDAAMRDTNMHNATIWIDAESTPYLVFPANDAGKVFTTTLNGELVDTLEPPSNFEFAVPKVNEYFNGGGKFVPTDVEYLSGRYFITTGYSPLDYVLTANVAAQTAAASWHTFAFGGRGTEPGQFGTGHGITIAPDGTTIAVADRPNSEIDHFSAKGDYLDTVALPQGSFPCDIDYTSGLAIVGCLHGPDREKGAPIYILKDDAVMSTVMPKEELGLEKFTHIHNAVMIERNGRFYIIAQAWNPGDFAILEQVE